MHPGALARPWTAQARRAWVLGPQERRIQQMSQSRGTIKEITEVAVTLPGGWSARPKLEHLQKLFDAFDPCFDLLCVSDPIQNGVAIGLLVSVSNIAWARRLAFRAFARSAGTSTLACPAYAVCPPAIRLRFPDLFRTRWMHSACLRGTQPLGLSHIPLRPRAAGIARCESSPQRFAFGLPQLPIDPAEANRFVESVVVAERRWVKSFPFWQARARRLLVLRSGCLTASHAIFRGISNQEFGHIQHLQRYIAWCLLTLSIRVGDHEPIPEVDLRPLRQVGRDCAAIHRWSGPPPMPPHLERRRPGPPTPVLSSSPVPRGPRYASGRHE